METSSSGQLMESNCWEVYIIETSSGKLYTGITTNLARRFREHQTKQNGARFFHFSKAEKIIYREQHPNRSEASKREVAIKKLNAKQKRALIDRHNTLDL